MREITSLHISDCSYKSLRIPRDYFSLQFILLLFFTYSYAILSIGIQLCYYPLTWNRSNLGTTWHHSQKLYPSDGSANARLKRGENTTSVIGFSLQGNIRHNIKQLPIEELPIQTQKRTTHSYEGASKPHISKPSPALAAS